MPCEYSILAPDEPEEPEEGPSTTGPRIRGAGHRATRGASYQGQMETETGDDTRQRTLLAHSMQEDGNKECPPPPTIART